MKIQLTKPEFGEDQRGIVQALLSMPPVTRHEFYKSAEGQAILKGLDLVAENDKTPAQALGDKREWDKVEIDKMVQQLQEASPEQKEIIFAMLPGPVIGIVLNRLNSLAGKTPEEYARTEGVPMEKGIRGPVKGTPGYFQWKQRLAATRAAKRAVTDAAKKSPTSFGNAPAVAPSKKTKKEKTESSEDGSYKHFRRKTSEKGKVSDVPKSKK